MDFIVSTLAALQLGEKLEGLQTAMEEFTEYLQTTKVYSSTEEARELFGNYKKHLPTKKEFQEKLGEYQRRIAGKIEEKGLAEYAESIRSHTKGFREQYQEKVSRIEAAFLGVMPYSCAISFAIGFAMTIATVLFAVAMSIAPTNSPMPS